jgi:hypothetical protein
MQQFADAFLPTERCGGLHKVATRLFANMNRNLIVQRRVAD